MSECPDILCVRTPNGLQAASAFDQERLERFAIGTQLEVKIRQPRSDALRRFYFAIIGAALPNLPHGFPCPDRDYLHDLIKFDLGYRTPFNMPAKSSWWLDGGGRGELTTIHEGMTVYQTDSTALKKMDEATFKEFVRLALDLIGQEYIPGLDINALKREAKTSLGRTFEKEEAA